MAVTAYPVIQVDSTDGGASDTGASGAGPATPITGAAASTNGSGTVVTLDGSPDLSGVAADGSHVILLNDPSSTNRRFAAINAVDNSAKTVTVEQALGTSLSGISWAIGGLRPKVFDASSTTANASMLMGTISRNGDIMHGWAVEMANGHTETQLAYVNIKCADTATARLTFELRGAVGSVTTPQIIFNKNGTNACITCTTNTILKDLEIRAAGGGVQVNHGVVAPQEIRRVKFTCDGIANFNFAIFNARKIIDCYIDGGGVSAHGIGTNSYSIAIGNYIKGFTGAGVYISYPNVACLYNIVDDCSYGFLTTTTGDTTAMELFVHNTVTGCTTAFQETGYGKSHISTVVMNNDFSNNNNYAIRQNVTGQERTLVERETWIHNNVYGNGTAPLRADPNNYTFANIFYGEGWSEVDPEWTNAAGEDYTAGENLRNIGFPTYTTNMGVHSNTSPYTHVGAAMTQAIIGTGGTVIVIED